MLRNLVNKTKKAFGVDAEDYKTKFYYSEEKVKELEGKLTFLCRQLNSVIEQVDTCTKEIKK